MKRFVFVLLLLSLPRIASAQTFPLKVHDHPQCDWYVSDDTPVDPGVTCHVPPGNSGQEHWLKFGDEDGVPCHIHIKPSGPKSRFPRYAELSTSFVVDIEFQLFHCEGYLEQVWTDNGAITLDAYNNEWREYIHVDGDPNGLKILPGKFWFDINRGGADHGWTGAVLHATVRVPNGDKMTKNERVPFWSMRNPAAPETPYAFVCDGCGPLTKSENDIQSAADGMNKWGAAIVQFPDMSPIAPLRLGAKWGDMRVQAFGYGSNSGLVQSFECRLDPDLHHGNPGTPIGCDLDTNTIGLGDHNVAYILNSIVPDGLAGFQPGEKAAVLEVLPITVVADDGAPPPAPAPTCQDQAATNFGGPLPCVFPPPPPSPWKTLFVDPNPPTKWLGQCIDTTRTLCWPTNMLAVCAGPDPKNCAWTSVIVP